MTNRTRSICFIWLSTLGCIPAYPTADLRRRPSCGPQICFCQVVRTVFAIVRDIIACDHRWQGRTYGRPRVMGFFARFQGLGSSVRQTTQELRGQGCPGASDQYYTFTTLTHMTSTKQERRSRNKPAVQRLIEDTTPPSDDPSTGTSPTSSICNNVD